MNARWRGVLSAAWQQSPWGTLILVMAVTAGILSARQQRGGSLWPDLALGLGLALLVLSLQLVQGLRRQNHPASARLVPGQLRTLRQLMLAAAALPLVGSLLLALLLSPADPLRTPLLVTLLFWLGAALTRPGWMLGLPLSAFLVLLALGALGVPRATLLGPFTLGLAAAVLLAAPHLLRGGGAAHQAAWERSRNAEALMAVTVSGGKFGALQGKSAFARLLAWWLWPVMTRLQRARHPVRDGADALRRALWLINPSLHVLQQAWLLIVVSVVVLPGLLAISALGRGLAAPTLLGLALIVGGVLWLLLLTLGSSHSEHWSTRGEQAVLRLAPKVPPGPMLAAAWGRLLRRHALAGVLLHVLPLGALLGWLAPDAWIGLLGASGVLAALAWTLSAVPLARRGAPRPFWLPASVALAVALAALCVWPLATPAGAWPLLPGLLAGVAAPLAVRRWRTESPPWPIGHASGRLA